MGPSSTNLLSPTSWRSRRDIQVGQRRRDSGCRRILADAADFIERLEVSLRQWRYAAERAADRMTELSEKIAELEAEASVLG